MLKTFIKTLFLVAILIVLPLFPHASLLLTWPIVTAVLTAFILQLSQPPVSNEDLKKRDPNDRRSVLFIYIAGTLVFLVPILDYAYFRQARPQLNDPVSYLGLFMIIGGLAFRIFSIRTLGKWFTSVVRVQEGQTVIQHGPYRWIRHPSYLGAFGAALGISIIFRSYAGLFVCFFVFLPVYFFRMSAEEKTLSENLGDPYVSYQKKTWKMVPFVY